MKKLLLLNEYNTTIEVFITASSKKPPSRDAHNDKLSVSKFGSEGFLGSAVALSLIRELGPVLTALMVTGRAGSAICAEIGIMRNSEQIDALECMAIDPHNYIMAPKFIAAIISMPLLTAIFDVVGIFGG